MQVVSTIGLITINETLVVILISFLIFLFLINRIMFRPLNSVIQERDDHITEIKTTIETSQTRLTEMSQQIREQELKAIKEANAQKEALEEDGTLHAKGILDESREEIQAIKLESQQFIDSQIAKARAEIKQESEKLAVAIMERVLDRRLAS